MDFWGIKCYIGLDLQLHFTHPLIVGLIAVANFNIDKSYSSDYRLWNKEHHLLIALIKSPV